jgi:putative salt-induced outer membrane protein
MRGSRSAPWRLSVALALCAPVAASQTPVDSFRLAFDLGYVNTAGNTAVTTLNFGEHLSYLTGRWTLAHGLIALEGRSQGVETAAPYKTDLRVDRSLAARLGAYALGGYDRNTFAGISRRCQEGAGLTAKILAKSRDALDAEAGIAFIQQRNTARVDDSFAAGRSALSYTHRFTEMAVLQQVLELLSNLKTSSDQLLSSETSLSAPMSKRIALKSAYLVRYDNLPEPGFKKSDRVFTTGIQIVFEKGHRCADSSLRSRSSWPPRSSVSGRAARTSPYPRSRPVRKTSEHSTASSRRSTM